MKLRVLSIGMYLGHEKVVHESLISAPALFDFDVIIADPSDCTDLWDERAEMWDGRSVLPYDREYDIGGALIALMNTRKQELSAFLGQPRLFVCFLRPLFGVHVEGRRGDKSPSLVHIYSWLPFGHRFSGQLVSGKGTQIKRVNAGGDFSPYFSAFKEELVYEAYLKSELDEKGYLQIFRTLARDYVGHPIAFTFRWDAATVVFLPPVPGYDSEKMAGVLLQCIIRAFPEAQRTPPPQWVTEYRALLPGLESLDEKADKLTDEIKRLGSELKQVHAKQQALEGHLRLLYEQGKYQLEPAVREVFDLIGFHFDEYGDADIVLDAPEGRALVEVEGKDDDAIKIDKHSQLLRYVTEYQKDTGASAKGILVGNAYRFRPVTERDSWFSDKVEKGAEAQDYCLLTTEELFKVVCALLANPSDELKAQIRSAILNTVGYFKFSG